MNPILGLYQGPDIEEATVGKYKRVFKRDNFLIYEECGHLYMFASCLLLKLPEEA
jgi:hypothetical protein